MAAAAFRVCLCLIILLFSVSIRRQSSVRLFPKFLFHNTVGTTSETDKNCDVGKQIYIRQTARIVFTALASTFGQVFPLVRETRRGILCLALPDSLFRVDITICHDVERNPGPTSEALVKNCRASNYVQPCITDTIKSLRSINSQASLCDLRHRANVRID